MEVRHLMLLRELAERGTVGATARALRVSASAVSQQLRAAERDLGVPLVEPAGRGLRLTRAGELLADGAVEVASALAGVEARFEEFRGAVGGEVGVACVPSAAAMLLPGLFGRLAEGPVTVRIYDRDVAEAGYAELARDHDIVIGHRMGARPLPEWSRLSRVDLLREPLDVALPAGHPLAARDSLAPADLVDEPWVGVPMGYPFDDVRLAVEERTGARVRVVQRVLDNRLVEALVIGGHGIGLLPRFSTRAGAELVLRPLAGVPTGRTVSALARPEVARRVVVRHVIDELRAVGRELAG